MSSEEAGGGAEQPSSGRSMREKKRPNYRKMADVDEEPKKRGRPRKIPEVYFPVLHPQKPIVLFTHPRSCSTAFEKAVYQLDSQVEVEHEPYSQSFTIARIEGLRILATRVSSMNNKAKDYKAVTKHLKRNTGRKGLAKDMAYYCHKRTNGLNLVYCRHSGDE